MYNVESVNNVIINRNLHISNVCRHSQAAATQEACPVDSIILTQGQGQCNMADLIVPYLDESKKYWVGLEEWEGAKLAVCLQTYQDSLKDKQYPTLVSGHHRGSGAFMLAATKQDFCRYNEQEFTGDADLEKLQANTRHAMTTLLNEEDTLTQIVSMQEKGKLLTESEVQAKYTASLGKGARHKAIKLHKMASIMRCGVSYKRFAGVSLDKIKAIYDAGIKDGIIEDGEAVTTAMNNVGAITIKKKAASKKVQIEVQERLATVEDKEFPVPLAMVIELLQAQTQGELTTIDSIVSGVIGSASIEANS